MQFKVRGGSSLSHIDGSAESSTPAQHATARTPWMTQRINRCIHFKRTVSKALEQQRYRRTYWHIATATRTNDYPPEATFVLHATEHAGKQTLS
jgi:hypothetical protein